MAHLSTNTFIRLSVCNKFIMMSSYFVQEDEGRMMLMIVRMPLLWRKSGRLDSISVPSGIRGSSSSSSEDEEGYASPPPNNCRKYNKSLPSGSRVYNLIKQVTYISDYFTQLPHCIMSNNQNVQDLNLPGPSNKVEQPNF